jgi:methyl-accepting chemotaxis protein
MQWFQNLRLRTRLTIGFVIMALLIATMGLIAVSDFALMNEHSDSLYRNDLVGLSYIKEANLQLINAARAEKNLMLSITPEQRDRYKQQVEERVAMAESAMEKARPLVRSDEGKELMAQYDVAWRARKEVIARVVNLALQEGLQRHRASVDLSLGEGRQKSDVVNAIFSDLTKMKTAHAQQRFEESNRIYARTRVLMIATAMGLCCWAFSSVG